MKEIEDHYYYNKLFHEFEQIETNRLGKRPYIDASFHYEFRSWLYSEYRCVLMMGKFSFKMQFVYDEDYTWFMMRWS